MALMTKDLQTYTWCGVVGTIGPNASLMIWYRIAPICISFSGMCGLVNGGLWCGLQ